MNEAELQIHSSDARGRPYGDGCRVHEQPESFSNCHHAGGDGAPAVEGGRGACCFMAESQGRCCCPQRDGWVDVSPGPGRADVPTAVSNE